MTDDTIPGEPSGLDGVRAVLNQTQDVDLPDSMTTAPHPDDPPDPQSDDDPCQGMEPDRLAYGPAPHWIHDPTPPMQRAAAEPMNDVGNGKRLQIHFGRDLMYVPRVGWYCWTGQLWKLDPDELMVRALAQRIGPLIEGETEFLTVPAEEAAMMARRDTLTVRIGVLSDIPAAKRTAEDRTELREAKSQRDAIDDTLDKIGGQVGQRLRHAKAAGNTNSITNLLTEASVGLAVPLEDLDVEPLAINTESGILRFAVVSDADAGMSAMAQVTLYPHDRAALMTKIMPVRYDPNAKAPVFQKFLARIQPDEMMRAFLQRWFGLSTTAKPVQFLCFFYGDGNNGKSVLVDLMCSVYGGYAATANIKSLTGEDRRDGASATPDLVPLIGARYVRASEPKRGEPWQEDTVKAMTGGEKMQIRPLYGATIEAKPYFKLNVSGNDKPEIRGQDEGIWRRVRMVPFEVQIPKEELIEKDEFDPILYAERDGVFAWCVQGLLDYLEGGLQEPQQVLLLTQELREENDLYGAFVEDACLITGDASHRISTTDLVNAFHYWMSIGKRGSFKDQTVSRGLKDCSRRHRSRRTGQKFTAHKSGGYMGYLGIQLQPLFSRKFDDAPRDHTGRPLVKRGTTDEETE